MEKIAVLGAGNGGCAVSADLVRLGHDVSLYSRSDATLQPIQERGGLDYTGAFGEGFAPIQTITTDIRQAIESRHILVVTVPTDAHPYYARLLAPYLTEDHIVMLNPGHTGGGLQFLYAYRQAGGDKNIRTCETVTLTHGCRMRGPALVWVPITMRNLLLAAFPGKHFETIFPVIQSLFANVIPGTNVIETGLTDLNAMEHPAGMLLNAAWVEHTQGNFRFYYEGVSPSVARVMQAIDDERMAVLHRLNEKAGLGMRVMSFIEYFYMAGFTSKGALENHDMYQALRESEPNKTIKAPATLDHRYVNEDVGFGLVPEVEIGRWAGVRMPATEMLIQLASIMRGVDFWSEGLTLAKMGLAQVPMERLREYLWEGHL